MLDRLDALLFTLVVGYYVSLARAVRPHVGPTWETDAMRKLLILGSTGSIGTQALDVVRASGDLELVGLAAQTQLGAAASSRPSSTA